MELGEEAEGRLHTKKVQPGYMYSVQMVAERKIQAGVQPVTGVVGRTPPAGIRGRGKGLILQAENGSRGTRADQGGPPHQSRWFRGVI
jgi:hypothetical protein